LQRDISLIRRKLEWFIWFMELVYINIDR